MAIGEVFKAWGRGEGMDSLSYLWISQAESDSTRLVESRLDQENRKLFERGVWTEQQYLESAARANANTLDEMITDPASSPWGGFKEGAEEGLANMQSGVQTAANKLLGGALGFIPWQVWLAGGIFVAWKLGLLGKLLKR